MSGSVSVLDMPACRLGRTRLSPPRSTPQTPGGGAGPVFVLDASDESLDPFLPCLREGFEAFLVHAPRRADPRAFGRALTHGHWFVGSPEAPDPHGLFHALEALESLLLGCRPETPPILIGSDAGATLALATASCWGDRLRAVVAIGGVLPVLPEEVVRAEIRGLPILWLADTRADSSSRTASRQELEARGARVFSPARASFDASPKWLAAWLAERISETERAGTWAPER